MEDEPLLTLAEYAAWSKCSVRQVRRLIAAGRIVPAADYGNATHRDYRFNRTPPAPKPGGNPVPVDDEPRRRRRAPKPSPYKPQIVRL